MSLLRNLELISDRKLSINYYLLDLLAPQIYLLDGSVGNLFNPRLGS